MRILGKFGLGMVVILMAMSLQHQTVAQAHHYQWGSAGPAPADVMQAQDVLQSNRPDLLTVLYGEIGDATPIGYVLGTSSSEAHGVYVQARMPAGTCVDFDPNVAGVYLSGSWASWQMLGGGWIRVKLASDAEFYGLKVTTFWTPCVFFHN